MTILVTRFSFYGGSQSEKDKMTMMMFLVATGSLLKLDSAGCWKVPDSRGIEKTGAIEDLKLQALTLNRFSLRYSVNVSSYSDIWVNKYI